MLIFGGAWGVKYGRDWALPIQALEKFCQFVLKEGVTAAVVYNVVMVAIRVR